MVKSAMEQTQVNRYFQAQKRSNPFSNPAKRRKLTVHSVSSEASLQSNARVKKIDNKSVVSPNLKGRSTSRKSGRDKLLICDLLKAKAVTDYGEATSFQDDHRAQFKRKVSKPNRCLSTGEEVKESLPITLAADRATNAKEDFHLRRHRSIKIDPWIAAQSKLVLKQKESSADRACAPDAIRRETDRSRCPSSDDKSPLSSSLSQENHCVREESKSAEPGEDRGKRAQPVRSQLRRKYGHLLRGDSDVAKESSSGSDRPILAKSSTSEIPAYQRFKALTAPEPLPFELPKKYKDLLEHFKCVDAVLFLLEQRAETCTFGKLKKSVEDMSGRKFEIMHLAKMKFICPDALIFRQEKGLRTVDGARCSGFQLTIQPNFSSVMTRKLETADKGKQGLSPTVLVTRRALFEAALVKVVFKHHKDFLKSIGSKIADNEIKRWHPNFNLERVPDIEEDELPKAPVLETIRSAKDILNKKGSQQVIPQVAKAMEKVCLESNTEKELSKKDNAKVQDVIKPKENTNKLMASISKSLLDRIREKEQRNHERTMTRKPEQDQELAMMERLPEIARILKTYFVAEKKAAISCEGCVQKLTESYGSAISAASLRDHLDLLAKLVPSWLKILMVRKCPYVKLVKDTSMNWIQTELLSKKKEALAR